MRVLIAVSEAATRQQLEHFFLGRQHEITTCPEIGQARTALAQGTYSIVLIDLEPDTDGALALCREIRRLPHDRQACVLALPTAESPEAMRDALEAGADDYVVKPINPAALQLRLAISQRHLSARRRSTRTAEGELFDKEMRRGAVDRLRLEADMTRAVEAEQQVLHYQPIVSLTTGRAVAFEALVRWRHPERGLLGPAELIPACEASGLILPLGRWILRRACRQAVEWLDRFPGHAGIQVSVNISDKQLSSPEFLPELDRTVEETGVKPASIALELKEGLLVDAPESMAVLWQLRKRGFRLQIDNFGSGYTSLRELYRSPVETLKIDRSFISRMKPGGEDAEVVRAIGALGEGLGLAVVAEGIETSDQLAQVRKLRLPLAQGYFFSRPLPSDEAAALIVEDPEW